MDSLSINVKVLFAAIVTAFAVCLFQFSLLHFFDISMSPHEFTRQYALFQFVFMIFAMWAFYDYVFVRKTVAGLEMERHFNRTGEQ